MDFQFFQPRANPSARPAGNLAGPLVAAAQAQASALARVGARIGERLEKERNQGEVATKFAELSELITADDGYDKVQLRKAGLSRVLGPATQRGAQQGLEGDALQSFLVHELQRQMPSLNEAVASTYVANALEEKDYFIMRPETKGKLARLEGELRALNVPGEAIASAFARLGANRSYDLRSLQDAVAEEADRELQVNSFMASLQQAGGQQVAQTSPAAAEARQFQREQGAEDARFEQATALELRQSGANEALRQIGLRDQYDAILNDSRAKTAAAREGAAATGEAIAAARKIVGQRLEFVSAVPARANAPGEFAALELVAKDFDGTAAGQQARAFLEQKPLDDQNLKRAVLLDPGRVIEELTAQGYTAEEAATALGAALQSYQATTIDDHQRAQREVAGRAAAEYRQFGERLMLQQASADPLSQMLGGPGLVQHTQEALAETSGRPSNLLGLDKTELRALIDEFNVDRDPRAQITSYSDTAFRFSLGMSADGTTLVDKTGQPHMQEFADFLTGKSPVKHTINVEAQRSVGALAGSNVSPHDATRILEAARAQMAAEEALTGGTPNADGRVPETEVIPEGSNPFAIDPNDIK